MKVYVKSSNQRSYNVYYVDYDFGEILTKDQVREIYESLLDEGEIESDTPFNGYLRDVTSLNGTLTETYGPCYQDKLGYVYTERDMRNRYEEESYDETYEEFLNNLISEGLVVYP